MARTYSFFFTTVMIFIRLCSSDDVLRPSDGDSDLNFIERQKRDFVPLLLLPDSSCFGLTVSFVLPTDNKVRDVFTALAYETSFNFASTISDLLPPTLTTRRSSRASHAMKKIKTSINRKTVYKFLRGKIYSFGFDGRQCLLRAICEAAETPLGLYNGVLGDILHIILTPSTSKAENLNSDYYEAEATGKEGDCSIYHDGCSISILDIIST